MNTGLEAYELKLSDNNYFAGNYVEIAGFAPLNYRSVMVYKIMYNPFSDAPWCSLKKYILVITSW